MIPMILKLAGDDAWPELKNREIVHLGDGAPAIHVAVLDKGLASGRPSVAMRFDMPDGRHLIAETSARLFCSAAKAIMAKYPDLFVGD